VEDGIGSGVEVVEDGAIGAGPEVDVEIGIAGGPDIGEDGVIGAGTEYGVEGENKSAEEVGLDGDAEVSVEEDHEESEDEFDENSDSDDDFDVHSWKEFEEELPSDDVVGERFCIRHIYLNFRKKFPGKNLKLLLWKATYCTHHQAWNVLMREIKEVNLDAFKHLLAIP